MSEDILERATVQRGGGKQSLAQDADAQEGDQERQGGLPSACPSQETILCLGYIQDSFHPHLLQTPRCWGPETRVLQVARDYTRDAYLTKESRQGT